MKKQEQDEKAQKIAQASEEDSRKAEREKKWEE